MTRQDIQLTIRSAPTAGHAYTSTPQAAASSGGYGVRSENRRGPTIREGARMGQALVGFRSRFADATRVVMLDLRPLRLASPDQRVAVLG